MADSGSWNPVTLYKDIAQAHEDLQGLNVSKEDALTGKRFTMRYDAPIATPEITNLTEYATTATSDKANMWESFKAGAEASMFESVKAAGMIDDYIEAPRTPGYSGIDSPIYQNADDDYKMKYGHLYATSPNEDWSKKLDERIKKYEELSNVAGANFWSGFVGAGVGGLLDPGTLLAMSGGLIVRSAKLGAMGYTYSELRSTTDPTYTSDLEANASAAAMTVVLGNAFHYVGSAATGFKKGYSDYWQGKAEAPEVKLTDLETGKSTGAMATEALDPQSYKVAKTNFLHKALYNIWKPFSAEYRLLDSDINTTRQLASQILEPNNRSVKSIIGDEATPISVVELREVEAAKMLTKTISGLDQQYVEYRKAGGKLSQDQFDIRVGEYLNTGRETDQAIIQAASGWTEVWDTNWKAFKDIGVVEKDAVSERRMPFYADRRVIDNDPADFRIDVEQQVLSQAAKQIKKLEDEVAALKRQNKGDKPYTQAESDLIKEADRVKAMLSGDRNEINAVVADIVNKMMSHADGQIVVHGNFKAQTLQKVKFDFDGDFKAKWGITNLRTVAKRYAHESATAKVLQERFGTQDVVQYINQKVSDEVEQKLAVIMSDPNLSTKQKNKMYKDLKEMEIRDKNDLLDIFKEAIGKQHVDTPVWQRQASSIAKGAVGLQTLGNRVIGNISDLAHAQFTHAPIKALGEHANQVAKEIINGIKPLTKAELREFGVLIDEITQQGASRGMLDEGHTAYSTWTEQLVQKGMEFYNNIQGFTAMQNGLRKKTFNNLSSDILEWSAALVDGKLKPDSYEALQLKKYGVTKQIAREFIDNFDKHHTVENKIVDLQLSKWDYNTQVKLGAIVKQRINQHIVNNTPGATAQVFYNPWVSVLAQFQKFIHLSMSKLLIPATQDLSGVHPRAAIAALGTIATDMFVGVVGGHIRSLMSGKDDTELTPERAIIYALERSAILAMGGYISNTLDIVGMGAASLLGEKEYSRFAKPNLTQLAGPTVGQLSNLLNVGNKFIHDDMTTQEWLQLKRLMPFNNFFIYNWYLNKMIKENT